MNREQFCDFISRQKWIFAKTYANKAPHEYCLKRNVEDESEFVNAAQYILDNGIPMHYYNTDNKPYVFLDGRMYWICSNNLDDTILINRCEVADYDIECWISWNGNRRQR